jgi:uncharacterized membrane protein YbhN (UPF0104 family)
MTHDLVANASEVARISRQGEAQATSRALIAVLFSFLSRPTTRFICNLAVSGLLITVVLRNIDLLSIGAQFSGQSVGWLLGAALVTSAQILLGALRWNCIIRGLGPALPPAAILAASYMGAFFNSWLLGNVGGDIARAALTPAGEAGRSRIVQSVLFDRLASLAGLGLVILPIVTFNLGPLARSLPLLLSLAAVALPFAALPVIPGLVRTVVGQCSLTSQIADLADNWRALCKSSWLAGALLAAGMAQVSLVAAVYCLARAQQLDVSFVDLLILMPPVVLVAALPISAGGWGVRENAMVMAMAPIGVAAGSAVLISVETALLAALLSLPGGVVFLGCHRLRLRESMTKRIQPGTA